MPHTRMVAFLFFLFEFFFIIFHRTFYRFKMVYHVQEWLLPRVLSIEQILTVSPKTFISLEYCNNAW